uniref:Uncharacterized protein n=1 Tax=candidate division WOR-3 bacterium TaxID=2052148 RepID=A0A7C6EBI1_UNCW3
MKYVDEIYQTIRDKFLILNQSVTNFNIGSRIRSLFEAIALAIEELWFRLDAMYQGLFAATAKDEDLDWRGLELGLTRKPAQKSTGYVRFYGDEDTIIPLGTICSTNPNIEPVIEFLTTEPKTIPTIGYIDIPVESKEIGKKTNVEKEKVIYLPESIPGVTEIKNIAAITGGEDIEDDESFRKRIVLRWYQSCAGGTEEFFRSIVLQVQGVVEVRVVACGRGPGTVVIYPWSKDAEGKLIPASDSLIADIEEYLEDKRPLCIQVYIQQPPGILQDVFLYLKVKDGYTFSTVADLVRGAIAAYFTTLLPGEALLIARLYDVVMDVEGVYDIKVEIPKTNIIPALTETIILGRCQIQPFEALVEVTW